MTPNTSPKKLAPVLPVASAKKDFPKPASKKTTADGTTNGYECTLILSTNLEEADKNKLLAKLKGIFEEQGGKILKQARWGKRKLAYLIRKQAYGDYYLFYLSYHPVALKALETQLRIEEQVLRWLSVSVEDWQNELDAFEKMKQNQDKVKQDDPDQESNPLSS